MTDESLELILELIIDAWCRAGEATDEEERIDSFGEPIQWSKFGVPGERGWQVCRLAGQEGKLLKVIAYAYSKGKWVLPEEYLPLVYEATLPERPPHRSKNKVKPH